MIAVHLPADAETRLEALAKRAGSSKESLVREAILKHIQELEAVYLAEQHLLDRRA